MGLVKQRYPELAGFYQEVQVAGMLCIRVIIRQIQLNGFADLTGVDLKLLTCSSGCIVYKSLNIKLQLEVLLVFHF